MSDTEGTNLQTHVPGDVASVDTAKLEALLKGKPAEVIGALADLSNDELDLLGRIEQSAKKPRALVLKAIGTELGSREVDSVLPETVIQGSSTANLGDRERYANMPASEIDPTKIKFPVLSRDGWVLPAPRAEG